MTTFLPSAGGYRKLRAFQMSEIIYDLSVIFADKFIRQGSRTRDQIEQAARSGKQNIAEGSEASRTSKETEIKLTNVAKASLEELLLDYEDYLRQHNLSQWDKAHSRSIRLREYLKSDDFMKAPSRFADRPSERGGILQSLYNANQSDNITPLFLVILLEFISLFTSLSALTKRAG